MSQHELGALAWRLEDDNGETCRRVILCGNEVYLFDMYNFFAEWIFTAALRTA